jgi:hypothetical protein
MLVELGDCLVMVHRNFNDSITDPWFIEDMNKQVALDQTVLDPYGGRLLIWDVLITSGR